MYAVYGDHVMIAGTRRPHYLRQNRAEARLVRVAPRCSPAFISRLEQCPGSAYLAVPHSMVDTLMRNQLAAHDSELPGAFLCASPVTTPRPTLRLSRPFAGVRISFVLRQVPPRQVVRCGANLRAVTRVHAPHPRLAPGAPRTDVPRQLSTRVSADRHGVPNEQ